MTIIRSYRELKRLDTFEERFEYLTLGGSVGELTFGFDRYINQSFYHSREWRQLRNNVIARDWGRDLGVEGYEIRTSILVHHINPIGVHDLTDSADSCFDIDNLITTTHKTHNAIHYGDANLLPRAHVERKRHDTKLW